MNEKIKKVLKHQETLQFVRFCIVGGICAVIDAAAYYVVLSFALYQFALVFGYLTSLCFNYFLTIYWTFHTKPAPLNFVGIIGAHMFNLFVVRMGLMTFFVEIMRLKDTVAYIPMAAISAFTNYLVIRTVVKYSKKRQQKQ